MSEQPFTTKALIWFANLTLDEQIALSYKHCDNSMDELTVRQIMHLYGIELSRREQNK